MRTVAFADPANDAMDASVAAATAAITVLRMRDARFEILDGNDMATP